METGALVGARGAYRLTASHTLIEVPATVQAILASRIDRLDPAHKRLLQAAAVVGKDVPYSVLQAIADVEDAALRQGLEALQSAEFLYETTLFPDLEYTFKHALTHEVAYSGMLNERRGVLHRRIVDALETLYSGRLTEQVERLAHHALRGELWDKAYSYSRQAGEKAIGRSANREAIAAFEQGFVALKHLPETLEAVAQAIDVRLLLQMPLTQTDQYHQMLDNLQEAHRLAQNIDDPLRKARVHAFLCEAHSGLGHTSLALDFGRQAVAAAERLGKAQLIVLSKLDLGIHLHNCGRYGEAAQLLAASAEAGKAYVAFDDAEKQGVLPSLSKRYARYGHSWAQAINALCLAELGAFEQASTCIEQAIAMAQGAGMYYPLAGAYCWGALASLRRGEVKRGVELVERCLDTLGRTEIPNLSNFVSIARGYSCVLTQRYQDGISWLEQARRTDEASYSKAWTCLVLAHLAQCYQGAGRAAEALKTVTEAIEFARRHDKPGHEAWAHYVLGEVLAQRDPPDVPGAQKALHQGLSLARELGMRPLEAQCLLQLGSLRAGPVKERHAQVAAASALFREMGMQFWLDKAEALLSSPEMQ